jgi:hypothetical protein
VTPFAEAALRYAKLGLAVVPLKPKGKRPMFENWPEVATADIGVVSRWWQQNPNANVGIATGQKSRVFVLDVDVAKGGEESYEGLVAKHGRFPDTWQQITGSGGFHLFFRYPNFRIGNAAGIFPGIDIRGDGGQVVAPPSIHPDTGRQYEWDGLREIEQAPLAEAPAWLLDILQVRTSGGGRSAHLPVALEIPEGTRHETMLALAGMMRRLGLDPEEMIPTMMAVNSRRCRPPEPDRNIRSVAESMTRYRPSDADLFTTANRLWRVTKARECEAQREREKNQVEIVDGLTVYRAPAQDQRCVIDNLLFHGLTVFAGRPKVGKSWLTLQMALDVARGARFLGGLDVLFPGKVVYCALEESAARTSGRMHKLLPVEEVQLQNISMVYALAPLMSGGLEQLDQLLENQHPNLVIVDTFLALVGGGGKSKDVLRSEYREIDVLTKLARARNTAIVLVHHLRKPMGGEGGIDAVAGSTGVTAAADAIWTLRREDPETCILDVVGRECEEQSLALRFKSDGEVGWGLIGDGRAVKDMRDEGEILKLLEHEGALTVQKVSTLLRLNANHVRSVLYSMRERNLVGRNGSGSFYLNRQAQGGEYA